MKCNQTGLGGCCWVDLPKFTDIRGNLTVVESAETVPFDIKRIYYLYDIPAGATRAGHAHRELAQLFIPLSGSFDLLLDDGNRRITYQLNRPYKGLYVCPMVWRELENFTSGSICLVLASHHYDEADYYRSYNDFLRDAK